MYFRGQLAIDPSQSTELRRSKPTRAFAKVLHWITAGLSSPKEEQETFSALSILQALNQALRTMGVDNVVRLAKDSFDIYLDEEGKTDDLKEALQHFRDTVDPIESEVFEMLTLVVEHDDGQLQYLIEFQVRRTHKVGEAPVIALINAVPVTLRAQSKESVDGLRQRMKGTFASTEAYEQFVTSHKAQFEAFVGQLELAIRKHLPVDEIESSVQQRIVRPKKPLVQGQNWGQNSGQNWTRNHDAHEPIFYGYAGYGDAFMYAWLWSEMCHAHHMPIMDTTIVDGMGETIMDVGASGFDAGENGALDPSQPFEAPSQGDIAYHGGNEYSQDIQDAGLRTVGETGGGETVDSFGGWEDGDSLMSSCSSCSSCGGCGGE